MMTINNTFDLKQLVYLVTDPDQHPRLVTGIRVTIQGLTYELTMGDDYGDHFAFEISETKNHSLSNETHD